MTYAIMVILSINWQSGDVVEKRLVAYDTVTECLTHKRQKEFTDVPSQNVFRVMYCEERIR